MANDNMNEVPEDYEMAKKMVMGVIEDSLQPIASDRLREESYLFWDRITSTCDYQTLRKIYYNVNKFVNRTDNI